MTNFYQNKTNKTAKILILFLLFLVVVIGAPSHSSAAEFNSLTSLDPSNLDLACDKILGIIPVSPSCILYGFTTLMYGVLTVFSWLLVLTGFIFDKITIVMLNPEIYDVEALRTGWTLARDTANLFFIFILLFVSIATILQLGEYNFKKILPRLIAAALLINFSFVITQYVIFASNSMTKLFIPGISSGSPSSLLSEKIASGLNPQIFYKTTKVRNLDEYNKLIAQKNEIDKDLREGNVDETKDQNLADARKEIAANIANLKKDVENPRNTTQLILDVLVSTVGAIIFTAIAAFVLGAAAILLSIRVVVLWFLLILSPVAFLFWVLPGLKNTADRWWSTLLHQSFFAPAFFFLFAITVSMISTETLEGVIGAANENTTNVLLNAPVILYFILISVMVLVSLQIANKMGAYGAGAAMGYATSGLKYARNYAGRVAGRWTVGKTAEALRGKGAAGQVGRTAERFISRIPFVGAPAARGFASGLKRASEIGRLQDLRKRQAGSFKEVSEENRSRVFAGSNRAVQDSILKDISDREKVDMFMKANDAEKESISNAIARTPKENQEKFASEYSKQVMSLESPRQIVNNMNSLLDNKNVPRSIKSSVLGSMKKEDVQKLAGHYKGQNSGLKFAKDVGGLRNDKLNDVLSVMPSLAREVGKEYKDVAPGIDFKKISDKDLTPEFMDEAVKVLKGSQIKDIAERGDSVTEKTRNSFRNLGENREQIENYFEQNNRRTFASWMRKRPGRDLMDIVLGEEGPNGRTGGPGGGGISPRTSPASPTGPASTEIETPQDKPIFEMTPEEVERRRQGASREQRREISESEGRSDQNTRERLRTSPEPAEPAPPSLGNEPQFPPAGEIPQREDRGPQFPPVGETPQRTTEGPQMPPAEEIPQRPDDESKLK